MSLDLTHVGGQMLTFKCPNGCGPLFRVTKPDTYDWVFCAFCRGRGDYEKVVHKAGKIIARAFSREEAGQICDHFGLILRDES